VQKKLEEKLRDYKIPIICRISDDRVLLDTRTLKEEEFNTIVNAIKEIENRR